MLPLMSDRRQTARFGLLLFIALCFSGYHTASDSFSRFLALYKFVCMYAGCLLASPRRTLRRARLQLMTSRRNPLLRHVWLGTPIRAFCGMKNWDTYTNAQTDARSRKHNVCGGPLEKARQQQKQEQREKEQVELL